MTERQKASILFILILLIPILLTDPLDWPKRIEPVATSPTPAKSHLASAPRKAPGFQSWSDPSFDREAFLASFKRQAALGLRECLIASNLSERAFSASATLNRRGELSHIHWNNEEALPECAVKTMSAMNFARQGEPLKRSSIEIQWRVDW